MGPEGGHERSDYRRWAITELSGLEIKCLMRVMNELKIMMDIMREASSTASDQNPRCFDDESNADRNVSVRCHLPNAAKLRIAPRVGKV